MFLKNKLLLSTACLTLVACGQSDDNAGMAASTEECVAANMVIHNTTIYTADDDNWTAEAVATLGDKIIYVGDNAGAEKYMCGDAEIMDMNGKYVYAGFTDGHQHVEGIGKRPKTLSLFGIGTLKETVDAIKAFSDANVADGDWVLGRGWIEREWTDEERFLTRNDVDPFTAN
ncbi:amidohydrolase family protein, partial [Emcibacteraceae bacterium]|nr:amidohydrolase family protein [Emcibacteraceae bacterium]